MVEFSDGFPSKNWTTHLTPGDDANEYLRRVQKHMQEQQAEMEVHQHRMERQRSAQQQAAESSRGQMLMNAGFGTGKSGMRLDAALGSIGGGGWTKEPSDGPFGGFATVHMMEHDLVSGVFWDRKFNLGEPTTYGRTFVDDIYSRCFNYDIYSCRDTCQLEIYDSYKGRCGLTTPRLPSDVPVLGGQSVKWWRRNRFEFNTGVSGQRNYNDASRTIYQYN